MKDEVDAEELNDITKDSNPEEENLELEPIKAEYEQDIENATKSVEAQSMN